MLTFDRKFARLLLEICRYTYSHVFNDKINKADAEDSLNEILKYGTPYDNVPTTISDDDTSVACITSYPDKNIVSYMGTKTEFTTVGNTIVSVEDWLKNISAVPVKFKLTHEQVGERHPQNIDIENLGGLVHEGFLQELSAVQAKVVDVLLSRGGRSRPVYITGHSQGGAEAALATRALLAGGFPVVATYTFAAPRAGNMDFVKSIPATLPVHRIEFGDDIVPHVPPRFAGELSRTVIENLSVLPFLSDESKYLLSYIKNQAIHGYSGLGRLCYGSNKTQSLRVDLSPESEKSLFFDRLWSLVRHPDRWAEHHHLAGTSNEVKNGKKGNYTSLVSIFPITN